MQTQRPRVRISCGGYAGRSPLKRSERKPPQNMSQDSEIPKVIDNEDEEESPHMITSKVGFLFNPGRV